MAKQYNIRWTENDSKQLSKSVKNFNAKVKRLEKKYEGIAGVVIPEKLTVREMRELIGTRRDLQKELKSLQSFTQRGSEEIVRAETQDTIFITKWQKQELEKRAKVINVERDRRREELESKELIHKGEGLGYTRGAVGMGKAEALQLRPTKAFTSKMSKADVNAKMKHYRRESQSTYWKKRDILMRDNYIKALKEQFNSKANDIIAKIQSMDVEEVKNIIMSDPSEFETAYPLTAEEVEPYLEHLREMWNVPAPQNKPKTKSKKSKKKSKKSKKKSKKRK